MRVRARLKRLDPVTWTLVGERESPWGTWSWPFTRERLTVPVKPFWGVTVRVVWALSPCWTARLEGLREREKVGEGVDPPPPPPPEGVV